MPSSRRLSLRDDPPTFFVDRGLGRRLVPAVFTAAGFEVVLMADFYPGGLDQAIPDDQWIAEVAQEGWVALTKDVSIVRDHQSALLATDLRVFALGNANIAGDEMARRFEVNLHRIVHRARKPGPFVYVVHSDRIEPRWPTLARRPR